MVPNVLINNLTSEILNDCKYISKCLTALESLIQALLMKNALIQAFTAKEGFLAEVSSVQALSTLIPLAANKVSNKQYRNIEQVHITSPLDISFLIDKCTNNLQITNYPNTLHLGKTSLLLKIS